ncbi:hypothetical protein [Algoriphagus pacificus]|uniref:Uncharacterized protein n=1 Tax=Algoriphagus pacificus TaxID=2811234 RepID=A0ABS3CE34_9BACT|nr:hypothetical protein [Algoriphagus pacificus]MBN7815360.1 hypothetical protein [Algoriphagus pacificus]
MELEEIRSIYKRLEQLVLILMLIALPLFGMIYLYHNSGNLDWGLPALPDFVNGILAGAGTALLLIQYFLFHRKLKETFHFDELLKKVKIYAHATRERFFLLFICSLIATLGLLFFGNPYFIVLFAGTLVFFSLAKPTPDRIGRLLKLRKEERDLILNASRPE